MDTQKVGRFIELDTQKKALEEQVKAISEEIAALNDKLVEEFAAEGLQNLKVGKVTAYLRRDIYASLQSKDALKIISELEGWSWLIKEHIPSQTLSAHVRQLEFDAATDLPLLPAILDGHVKVSEVYNIRVRRG